MGPQGHQGGFASQKGVLLLKETAARTAGEARELSGRARQGHLARAVHPGHLALYQIPPPPIPAPAISLTEPLNPQECPGYFLLPPSPPALVRPSQSLLPGEAAQRPLLHGSSRPLFQNNPEPSAQGMPGPAAADTQEDTDTPVAHADGAHLALGIQRPHTASPAPQVTSLTEL